MPLVIFLILAILMYITWDWLVLNINVLSAIATSLAFFATAWAAHEARKSAKAALKAVKTADETLKETRKNYQRDAFEKRYSLLLEQHNQQLKNVYEYLSSNTEDANGFIEKVKETQLASIAASYLNGHSIISPYMRTLYHLLKHVYENFYVENVSEDEEVKRKKEYTSPLRSLIRNDVLYLIGLNSLVTKVRSQEIYTDNGYGYYQFLLNYFNFFEHAVFFDWRSNVRLDDADEHMINYLDERFMSKIKIALRTSLKDNNCNDIPFIRYPPEPPVYLAMNYVYKTAANDIMMSFFNGFDESVKSILSDEISSAKDSRRKIFESINSVRGNYVGVSYNQTQLSVRVKTKWDLLKMIFNYRKNHSLIIDGVVPAYFVNVATRAAGNTFSIDTVFADQMRYWVAEYIYYSDVISFSKSNEKNLFVANFIVKSHQYISFYEGELRKFISDFQK